MKANSLEELVTNSNIAGELRNYTDWHTRLVKFAQLVANWQKEQMLKDAVEVEGVVIDNGSGGTIIDTQCGVLYLPPLVYAVGEKVRIVVLKKEE